MAVSDLGVCVEYVTVEAALTGDPRDAEYALVNVWLEVIDMGNPVYEGLLV
ncbi:hypothetical protein D3C81_2193250 [compost metagenome]